MKLKFLYFYYLTRVNLILSIIFSMICVKIIENDLVSLKFISDYPFVFINFGLAILWLILMVPIINLYKSNFSNLNKLDIERKDVESIIDGVPRIAISEYMFYTFIVVFITILDVFMTELTPSYFTHTFFKNFIAPFAPHGLFKNFLMFFGFFVLTLSCLSGIYILHFLMKLGNGISVYIATPVLKHLTNKYNLWEEISTTGKKVRIFQHKPLVPLDEQEELIQTDYPIDTRLHDYDIAMIKALHEIKRTV